MPLAPTQFKFVTVVCLPLVLACLAVSFWQTYFFLTSLRRTGALTSELGRQVLQTSVLIAGITLLVLVPVFILIAVWVSYRVVGPMRRLAAELKAVAEGKVRGGFHFRRGDELAFVAEAVSEMERSLLERLDACRSSLEKVEEAAAGLGSSEAVAVRKRLSDLREKLDGIGRPEEPTPADTA